MTYNTISTKVAATASVKVVDMVKAQPCRNGNGFFVSARVHAANGTATVTEWVEKKAGAEALVAKLGTMRGEKVTVKLSQRNVNTYDDGRQYTTFLGKFSL